MSINITGKGIDYWTSHLDDMTGWEENGGLGFAYMYDNNQATPFIGVSMFDETGKHVNDALTFNAGFRIDKGWDEQVFSEVMRSGVIETEASEPGSYSILTASGPYSIGAGKSISPFTVAFIVGKNLSDLKAAANQAYQRSNLLTSNRNFQGLQAGDRPSLMNYPNPFKGSTSISFTIHQAEHVKLEVFNFLGQKVITLLNQTMPNGEHRIEYYPKGLDAGVYILRMNTETSRASRKIFCVD
jgi:hypothetical protein